MGRETNLTNPTNLTNLTNQSNPVHDERRTPVGDPACRRSGGSRYRFVIFEAVIHFLPSFSDTVPVTVADTSLVHTCPASVAVLFFSM